LHLDEKSGKRYNRFDFLPFIFRETQKNERKIDFDAIKSSIPYTKNTKGFSFGNR